MMGFDFLLVQPQAFIEKKKPRLRRYTWQAMPAYAIKVKTVIVIDNVLDTISALQGNLTGTVSTVETGVYTFENEALEELVMSSSSAPLLPGCYPVLSDTKTTASQIVDICDEEYYFINSHEIKFLIRTGR